MGRLGRATVLLAVAFAGCGEEAPRDPCAPKIGCLRSHMEKRERETAKCLRSHKEQRYHRGLVYHFLKPHWRWEMKADRELTVVCDEYEQETYEVEVCDETGVLRDASGAPIPVDPEGCERKRAAEKATAEGGR